MYFPYILKRNGKNPFILERNVFPLNFKKKWKKKPFILKRNVFMVYFKKKWKNPFI